MIILSFWVHYGRLRGKGWKVELFHSRVDAIPYPYNEGEEGRVTAHHVSSVLDKETSQGVPPLANLRYLIPVAIYHRNNKDSAPFLNITECP